MLLLNQNFDPKETFDNGQCFRWEKINDQYVGVVEDALLKVSLEPEGYVVNVVLGKMSLLQMRHYFDLETDYEAIRHQLSLKDEHLKAAITQFKGLRLLNQDPFETLISFIVSANNNIPKIKMTIEALAQKFGTVLGTYENKCYYTFPKPEVLAAAEVSDLNVKSIGYRNKAVHLAALKICQQQLNLGDYRDKPYLDRKAFLKTFYGIGDKVADCILLFSMEYKNAFPIDTWVKKMLQRLYDVEDHPKAYQAFVEAYFTEYAGIAQQFLFYYMRENR